MRPPPPQSSPALQPAPTDAARRNDSPSNADQRAVTGLLPATQFPDKILKAIADKLGRTRGETVRLPDSTFKQAVSLATPHLKLARPADLDALIAAHTDAHGRTDCSRIKKITLSHSSFTNADLARLQRFTSLHEVDFSDCTNITGVGIAKLPPTVKVANFTGCNAITDTAITALPPALEEVNFTDCANLTSAGVAKLPRTVKVADFTGCIALNGIRFDAILPNLEKVDFTDCINLTDADLGNLPGTVKVASFSGCNKISAVMIEKLQQRGVSMAGVPPSVPPAPAASHRRQRFSAPEFRPNRKP